MWGYTFDGAYASAHSLESKAGVYVIWCETPTRLLVLDVGESGDLKGRVANHERAGCWSRRCTGRIRYSATYTPDLNQAGRLEIEARIRSIAAPPCGAH